MFPVQEEGSLLHPGEDIVRWTVETISFCSLQQRTKQHCRPPIVQTASKQDMFGVTNMLG